MKQAIFAKGQVALLLGAAMLLGACTEAPSTNAASTAAPSASAAQEASESGNTMGQSATREDVGMDCIPGEGLPGGWHRQGEVTDEARAALDSVLSQMNSAAKLKSIREVRTQVVAGINYAIEFEMDNGEVWNTVVYRDLKGQHSMKQVAKQGSLKPFCPPK